MRLASDSTPNTLALPGYSESLFTIAGVTLLYQHQTDEKPLLGRRTTLIQRVSIAETNPSQPRGAIHG